MINPNDRVIWGWTGSPAAFIPIPDMFRPEGDWIVGRHQNCDFVLTRFIRNHEEKQQYLDDCEKHREICGAEI